MCKPLYAWFVLTFGFPLVAVEVVPVGAGSYLNGLPEGAKGPPVAPFVTEDVHGPVPTNTWWSSLAWEPLSDTMFPHPFSVKATNTGWQLNYPGAHLAANKDAIMGMGGNDLTLGNSAVNTFRQALVSRWSDSTVTARLGEPGQAIHLTFGHGLPYAFATYEGGEPVVFFKSAPRILEGSGNTPALVVEVGDRVYGLYAPQGTNWLGLGTAKLIAQTNGKNYFSVAVLPDHQPATLKLFQAHAYAHVTEVRAEGKYDRTHGLVSTTFTAKTEVKEGTESETLFALYPHQWRMAQANFTGHSYASVRGPMKLSQGNTFTSAATLPALLPGLPLTPQTDRGKLTLLLTQDLLGKATTHGDTYWLGKQLGKWSNLLPLAEELQDEAALQTCTQRLKESLENFLSATRNGETKKLGEGFFAYDPRWGTLIGYPASFGSDDQLNDHHFHYGYFLRAAGELARRDPTWIKSWGPMVRLLARDIASADRQDKLFPYLRCFDVYAGHSWASGHAKFGDGNNQESSSESINAWYGLMLLGETTGDLALRDQAAWMLGTEVSAIEDYWFNVHGDLFPKTYPASVVTMIWGGKGANATWFSADPQMTHGINFLPVTAGSFYLGRWPEYAKQNHDALVKELTNFHPTHQKKSVAPPPAPGFTVWADVLWMQQATFDAPAALKNWEARPVEFKPEAGNSLAQTQAWLNLFNEYGPIQRSVTADYPWTAVFAKNNQVTHVAWNLTAQPLEVKFSDGTVVSCNPGTINQVTTPAKK
jgi:endoglucanase Acf2